jgi:spore maturation protein CgeB
MIGGRMGNKTILMAGVFEEGSSNVGIADAFTDLGWSVKRFHYRKVLQTIGVEGLVWGMRNLVEAFKPELTFLCKFNSVPSDFIKELTCNSMTCLWFMDSMATLRETCPEIIGHSHNVTFSVHWPGVAKSLTELNVPNCYGIVETCSEKDFYPVDPLAKYKADISFIGTRNSYRDSYINALREAGFVVKAYGDDYDEYVTGDNFNAVCSSSKAILNIGTHNDVWGYWSDRIPRTLANKVLSLNHYCPGFEDYYTNFEHMVWFSSVDECVNLAKKYVNDDKERKRISESGYNLFLQEHTCKDFVEKVLRVLNIYRKGIKETRMASDDAIQLSGH